MQAVILVGGEGTRLRPLTQTMPKPLVPVLGRPFLFHQLDLLKKHGITDIVLCIGYLGEQFKQYLGDGSALGMTVKYAEEQDLLGTAGAVKNAAPFVEDDFIVMNGDTVFDIDLQGLMGFHLEKKALATIAVRKIGSEGSELTRRGFISMNDGSQIISFSEKPETIDASSSFMNGGVYAFSAEALDHIPGSKKISLEEETFPQLIATNRLFARPFDGYFLDMGTKESLQQLENDLRDMQAMQEASR